MDGTGSSWAIYTLEMDYGGEGLTPVVLGVGRRNRTESPESPLLSLLPLLMPRCDGFGARDRAGKTRGKRNKCVILSLSGLPD